MNIFTVKLAIVILAGCIAGWLIATGIALCLASKRTELELEPEWVDWPAQVAPFYCEGENYYGRNHCADAGLHQCGDCHREQRLNGITGATNDRHRSD